MAYFTQLDNDNVVIQCIVVNDEDTMDSQGVQSEEIGIMFCKKLFGLESNWKQTWEDGSSRVNFAGVGYSYNSSLDAFIPVKPFDTWVLNEETVEWEAPDS